jgi:hypothetical protein
VGYDAAVGKLPEPFQNKYHELWQMAVMYVVIMFDVRRGREGLCSVRKEAYQKQYDAVADLHFFQKVVGESSKNHATDQEDLEKSGIVPFYIDDHGFNPGRLLEIYMASLHPENPYLFQRQSPVSSKFDIHAEGCKVWFSKMKIGKNKVGQVLPDLCKTVGVKALNNHSIRDGIVII